MITALINFLNRHKRKFVYGGSVIAGFFALKKYAQHRLIEWHNKETFALLKKQKRKQHYEKSRQTTQAAVLSFSEFLTKTVNEELDSQSVLLALHQKPTNKQNLWEELKILGFAQILSSIYLSSLVVAVVNVKVMVISGYTFSKTESDPSLMNEHSTQELFLTSIQEFMQNGIPLLIKKVHRVVSSCVDKILLSQVVTIEQLEVILHDIILELAGEFRGREEMRTKSRLRPWSQYVSELSAQNGTEVAKVNELLIETRDILDSEDFNIVIEGLIQQGLNLVLDYVSEFFPQPAINNNDGAVLTEQAFQQSTFSPHMFTKTTLPIAKLIPIFSGSVHNLLSLGPGQLLQVMLLNNRLEVFSNNVYSAFCTDDEYSNSAQS